MLEAQEMAGSKVGRPKERPEGEHSFTLRLPLEQWRLLKGLATIKDLTATEAISVAIDLWLTQEPEIVAILKKSAAASSSTKKSAAKKKATSKNPS